MCSLLAFTVGESAEEEFHALSGLTFEMRGVTRLAGARPLD